MKNKMKNQSVEMDHQDGLGYDTIRFEYAERKEYKKSENREIRHINKIIFQKNALFIMHEQSGTIILQFMSLYFS